MRRYFKKLEKNQYLSPSDDTTKAHGFNGWFPTTIEPLALYTSDLNFVSIILPAASAMGIQTDSTLSYIRNSIRGNSIAGKVCAQHAQEALAN